MNKEREDLIASQYAQQREEMLRKAKGDAGSFDIGAISGEPFNPFEAFDNRRRFSSLFESLEKLRCARQDRENEKSEPETTQTYTYNAPEPSPQSLLDRAYEVRNYLLDLEGAQRCLCGSLFNPEVCGNGLGPIDIGPSSIEGVLADVCTRASRLVGEMRTINARVAG